MAVPLLLMVGGTVVRAVAPRVIQQLMRQGAKRATTQAVKKAGGTSNVPTVTSVKQAKNLAPKIRTAAGMKPFKPISGAGSRVPGRKIGEGAVQAAPKLSKPTTGAGRATLKKQPPSLKKTPPPMKKAPPSLKKTPKVIKTPSAVPKPRPKDMTVGPKITRSKIRPTPPARPTTKPKLSNVDKGLLAATGIAATQIGKKKEGPASAMAVPMPRPQRLKTKEGGPGRPFPPKDKTPKLKSTSFDKGGNTGFGVKGNSFVGGPAERAVMMKYYGGTGSQAAKAALAGTQGQLKKLGMDALKKERQAAKIKDRKARQASGMDNKAKGGKIGMKPITRTVNKYSTTKYDTPQKDAQYTGEKKITIGVKKQPGMMSKKKAMDSFLKKSRKYKTTAKGTGKKKVTPNKYKGFSQLPERVQQRMNPALAAKFDKGGSIKSGCARQVKGFGAARRPKK